MKRLGIVAGFLFGVLAARGAAANPIRANTPGTGVFQRSGLLVGVVADSKAGGDLDLSKLTSYAELRYTPDTHWVFGLWVPYVVESRVEQPGMAESASGPGDVIVSVKHRFYRWVGPWADRHAAVEIGLKLPTGATDRFQEPDLPAPVRHRLQPGTGSTDGLISLVYQQARRRWVFAGDVGLRLNSSGEAGFREGNEARLDLSTQYILFPRVYTRPGNEVFAVLEGTLISAGTDRIDGGSLPGTDRTALLLAPGLQYIATERLSLDLSVQFPVFEDVGRGAPTSRWNGLFQLRYAF
jgi:hypothetical protein